MQWQRRATGQGRASSKLELADDHRVAVSPKYGTIAILSASPTLGRQFTIVTNVVVVLAMLDYAAFSAALIVLSQRLSPPRRFWARVLGGVALLFCAAVIMASDPSLLIWSVVPVVAAVLAYFYFRMRNGARVALSQEI